MYIWIHDKYSSTSFKQRLWQRKIVLIWQNSEKLLIQIICVTVVQWSRSSLTRADKPGSTPGDAAFCFFVPFFSLVWSIFFLHYFSFWPFFLFSYCRPWWSCTWITIYFKLKSGVLFWKSYWAAYWPSLRPDKNHKLSRHVPPLKQLNFFQC